MRIIYIITFFDDTQIVDSKEVKDIYTLQEAMLRSAEWLRQANQRSAEGYKAIDLRIERSLPGPN